MDNQLTRFVHRTVQMVSFCLIGSALVILGIIVFSKLTSNSADASPDSSEVGFRAPAKTGAHNQPTDQVQQQQPAVSEVVASPQASAGASISPDTTASARANRPPIWFATVTRPGEKLADGDLEHSKRYFGAWELNCETAWSKNLRVCLIQQTLNDTEVAGASLVWRLATTINNTPMVAIRFPANIDRPYGVRMGFMGFERKLDERQWYCGPQQCIAMIPYKPPFSDWIATVDTVTFGHSLNGKTAEFSAPMNGFMAALSFMAGQGNTQPATAARPSQTRTVSNSKDQTR